MTPIATIYITITDRRNAEAARRRDRQQDSAQRLLEHVAGIVWYFRLIPGIYQSGLPKIMSTRLDEFEL